MRSFTERAVASGVSSCGRSLCLETDSFGELDAADASASSELLRSRIEAGGYLFFRRFLGKEDVLRARRAVLESLSVESALDPKSPLDDALAAPGFVSDLRSEEGRYPAIRQLPRDPAVLRMFERVLGETPLCVDHTWIRIKSPGRATAPHCDIVYHRKGSDRLHTIWIPLGDIPFEEGPLMLLEGSHRARRLRDGYCRMDISEGRNATRIRFRHGGFFRGGQYTKKPAAAQRELGGRWLTADFRAGDLVVFSAFVLHGALDNQTKRVRLSLDARFQPASERTDPRWAIKHG